MVLLRGVVRLCQIDTDTQRRDVWCQCVLKEMYGVNVTIVRCTERACQLTGGAAPTPLPSRHICRVLPSLGGDVVPWRSPVLSRLYSLPRIHVASHPFRLTFTPTGTLSASRYDSKSSPNMALGLLAMLRTQNTQVRTHRVPWHEPT